jgi:hypothetical protein
MMGSQSIKVQRINLEERFARVASRPPLPEADASPAAAHEGDGAGLVLCDGAGVGTGVGLVVPDGLGVGTGVGVVLRDGAGVGTGVGLVVRDGAGEAVGAGMGAVEAVGAGLAIGEGLGAGRALREKWSGRQCGSLALLSTSGGQTVVARNFFVTAVWASLINSTEPFGMAEGWMRAMTGGAPLHPVTFRGKVTTARCTADEANSRPVVG